MELTPEQVSTYAASLIDAHKRDLNEKSGRLGRVARYLRGEHDLPYAPRGAKLEYRVLAKKAITNWLPLISDTFAKGLFVDGYRPAKSADNSAAWDYWQANGLDARQSVVYRGALDHGLGWVFVLPGDAGPAIRPLSPLKVRALYEDDDDEWPVLALICRGQDPTGGELYDVVDDVNVWRVRKAPKSSSVEVVGGADQHGMGLVPLVRFRDRLDGESRGIIAPLITLQDRINEAVFALMIAIQYASFRQRWATGLAIPLDEDPYVTSQGVKTTAQTNPDGSVNQANPNLGKPVMPFQAAVDRLWVSDSENAKFGDFAQTEVSGHISNYEGAVKSLAAIGQVSPHVLLGDLVNLSADALAAAEASTQRLIGSFETLFGEAWEQVLRLAAAADGNSEAAADTSAEVRWRDTEARSLAATVDALGKIASMLQVPATELWEKIPGVTEGDVTRWREAAGRADGMAAIAAALAAHSAPAGAPGAPPGAPDAAGASPSGGTTVAPSGA